MSNCLQNTKFELEFRPSKTVNRFEIGWTVGEKSRPEHDPNRSRLCDLLPTEADDVISSEDLETFLDYFCVWADSQ